MTKDKEKKKELAFSETTIGVKKYILEGDQAEYNSIKDNALENTRDLFNKADCLKDVFGWAEIYYNEVQTLKEAWWANILKKYELTEYHCSYYDDYGFMLILDKADEKEEDKK